MLKKRHKPEEIVAELRQVDVLTSQGKSVADAIRTIGVTEVTYCRWRQEFGGLRSDQVKRLKTLEAENARLRRAVSDLNARQNNPGRGCPGKLLNPSRRRACIDHVRSELRLSERLWCKRFEVEPSRRREVALNHAARTAFQILGAVLPLVPSLPSLN
jgi:putative transposase